MLYDLINKTNRQFYIDMVPEQLQDFYNTPGVIGVGCCEEDETGKVTATGVMLLDVSDPDVVGINWLYVSPEYRGEDCGTLLLKQAFDLAKQMNRSGVTLRLEGEGVESYFTLRGFVRAGDPEEEDGTITLIADTDAMKRAEAAGEDAESWEDEAAATDEHFPKRFRVKSIEYMSGEIVYT